MAEMTTIGALEAIRRLRPQILALARLCRALREELTPYVLKNAQQL